MDRPGTAPSIFFVLLASLLLAPAAALADPEDQEFFTDFQDLDAEDPGSFSIGPAQFTGGDEFDAGAVPALYHGDDRAWILGPGKTMRIEFDVPMSVVEFRAVGLDGAIVRAEGKVKQDPPAKNVSGSSISSPLQKVRFTGQIDAIELENTSTEPDEGDWAAYGASLDHLGFSLLDVVARCASEQLKAASKFCSKEMGCWSKYVKKPEKDPGAVKREACRDKALATFTSKQQKAIDKAISDGGSCAFTDDVASFVDGSFLTPLAALRDDEILFGWDPDTADKNEAKVRSALVKQAGKLCGTGLKVEAKDATSDDPTVAEGKRAKARDKFTAKVDKTVAKGAAKGFPDPGFDSEAMILDVDAIVDDYDAMVTPPEE